MEKPKIMISKFLVQKIKTFPQKERDLILNQLKIINSSEDPVIYSYSTVSRHLGDLLFVVDQYLLHAKVTGNKIKIFNITN
jgi:hypothetical protein